MRKSILIYLTILMSAILLTTGCQKEAKVDQQFLDNDDICLKVKGNVKLKYDPLTCQMAYNAKNIEFRVHTDDMSDYYILTCSSIPTTVDQKITGSLRWTASSDVNSKTNLSFKVEKIEGEMIWLWCSKERIAVSVKKLD